MSCQALAPGIWSVSTDCHGGILISEERRDAMPAWARSFNPFSGLDTTFEEDFDWAVPCAVWPQEFKLDDCRAAIKILEHRLVHFHRLGTRCGCRLAAARDHGKSL